MTKDLRDPGIQKELYSVASKEYDDIIRKSDTLWGNYYEKKVFKLGKSVMPKKRGFMLDVGGGTGVFTKLFIDSFRHVVNTDLSRGMLNEAKKKGNILLIEADAQKLPFKDNSFDLILCADTLHHLPNAEKVISEIKRVTKTGGRLIVIEINKNWAHPLRRKLINMSRNREKKRKKLDIVLHQEEYTNKELEQIFKNVGLQDFRKYNLIFIPPLIQNKFTLKVLEFFEIIFEHIPIIKEMSGKICYVGFIN